MTAVKTPITVTICDPITGRRERKVHIDSLKPYFTRGEHLKRREYEIIEGEIVVGGRADSIGEGSDEFLDLTLHC